MHQAISLVDGVERNRAHPDTFLIPCDAEKSLIIPGDFVKLGFELNNAPEGAPNAERMWIRVTEEGKGTLENDPVFIPMQYGDMVEYESHHILAIIHA